MKKMRDTANCYIRNLSILVAVVNLSACSYIPWFGDDEKVEIEIREPSELVEFNQEVIIQQNWSVTAGSKSEKYIQLQPFFFEEKFAFVDTQGNLSVHDLSNGRQVWRQNIAENSSAGVGGNADVLVIGTNEGMIIAAHSKDGLPAWTADVGSEIISIVGASNSVAIVRTNNNRILAYDLVTGEKLWTVAQTPPALTLRGGGIPLVLDGIVYAGMDNGKVIAISIESGNVIWEARVSVPSGRSELERLVDVDGHLAADETNIYASSYHGRVVAINRTNGRLAWARDIASVSGVAADENLVYVSDRDDNVWALEKETGVSVWKQDKLLYRELSAPVAQSAAILVGDYDGYLHALSKEDGRITGRTNLSKDSLYTSPASTAARAYFIDINGRLASYSVVAEK